MRERRWDRKLDQPHHRSQLERVSGAITKGSDVSLTAEAAGCTEADAPIVTQPHIEQGVHGSRKWETANESDFGPGYSGTGHIGPRREGPPSRWRSEECLWRSRGPSTRRDPISAAKHRAATSCLPRYRWCGRLPTVSSCPASPVTLNGLRLGAKGEREAARASDAPVSPGRNAGRSDL